MSCVLFNVGCTVRDVTARYASNWCTYACKQRLSEEWWDESLRSFEPPSQDEREAEEEDMLCKLGYISLHLVTCLSSVYEQRPRWGAWATAWIDPRYF